jgi:carboxypeptidase C (cathepsin A)
MVKNPYMKVLVMQGFYDLATPFYAADWTMEHLNLDPKFHQSVTYATYDAGHMVYVDRKEHTKMKNDLVQFMQKAQ